MFKIWNTAYYSWEGEKGKNEDTCSDEFILWYKCYLNAISYFKSFSAFISFPPKSASASHSGRMQVHKPPNSKHSLGHVSFRKPAEVTELRCLYKTSRTTSQCKAVPSDSEKSISIYNNLSELLMAMQDELDQMTM